MYSSVMVQACSINVGVRPQSLKMNFFSGSDTLA